MPVLLSLNQRGESAWPGSRGIMYKEFFGLQKLPFNLTPDPAFLFLPLKHREAFAGLTYASWTGKGSWF